MLYSSNDGGEFNIYTDATGTLAFYGSSVDTLDVGFLDGKVGIGTTSPDAKLHIKADTPQLRLEETDASDKKWHIEAYNSGFGVFETGDDDRLYIETGGNVGIGTENPSTKLDVRISNEGYINLQSEVTNHQLGFRLENPTTAWCLMQNPGGSKDALWIYDEGRGARLCIDGATGNVGIGTTSPGMLYKLAVNGPAAKPGGGSWLDFSDIRLKEINSSYEQGLSEVCQLNPIRYNYKEGNELQLPTDNEYVGVTAQEVRSVIPEAVEENGKGYLMVNNDPIIWAMVNAIKELKAENESLKKQLKVDTQSLIQRLEVLERMLQEGRSPRAKEVQL
jgi:hypothetical protein